MKPVWLALWCLVACRPDHKQSSTLPLLDRDNPTFSVNGELLYYNQRPYTGGAFALHPQSDDTLMTAFYRFGALHGCCKKLYPSGALKEMRYFNSGKKHGKQVAYWSNGNKRFEFTAYQDAYSGVLREWSESGRLLHLATYAYGQEEGRQTLWYDNGKVRANYIIRNGKRYGLLGTKNCKNVSDSLPALP